MFEGGRDIFWQVTAQSRMKFHWER